MHGRLIAAAALVVGLAACGGGRGSNPSADPGWEACTELSSVASDLAAGKVAKTDAYDRLVPVGLQAQRSADPGMKARGFELTAAAQSAQLFAASDPAGAETAANRALSHMTAFCQSWTGPAAATTAVTRPPATS